MAMAAGEGWAVAEMRARDSEVNSEVTMTVECWAEEVMGMG